jgi:hypothetical protein
MKTHNSFTVNEALTKKHLSLTVIERKFQTRFVPSVVTMASRWRDVKRSQIPGTEWQSREIRKDTKLTPRSGPSRDANNRSEKSVEVYVTRTVIIIIIIFFFFFFYCRYNPLSVLALSVISFHSPLSLHNFLPFPPFLTQFPSIPPFPYTISFHSALSLHNFLHPLIPIICISFSMSSIHLFLGLPRTVIMVLVIVRHFISATWLYTLVQRCKA